MLSWLVCLSYLTGPVRTAVATVAPADALKVAVRKRICQSMLVVIILRRILSE
jgi:hypothetical protein